MLTRLTSCESAAIHLLWARPRGAENLGDYLSVLLLRAMGYQITRKPGKKRLLACGTILGDHYYAALRGDKNLVVWGSGAGSDMHKLFGEQRGLRFDFRAVRGPLTRDLWGLSPDMPLGDPAVLLPRFFPLSTLPPLEAGEEGSVLYVAYLGSPNLQKPAGAEAAIGTGITPEAALYTVSRIARSRFVLTSSLHGAILAQAYGVPWAPCWTCPLRINRFKWADWFCYLGIKSKVVFTETFEQARRWWEEYGSAGRLPDTRPLLDAFPHDIAVPQQQRTDKQMVSAALVTGKSVKPNTYAFTGPYADFALRRFYDAHAENLFGEKIIKEKDFREKLAAHDLLPDIMLLHNFIVERAGIVSLCRELGINTVHCEDGFFPHYGTVHADPLGFCWESSLSRMVFRECTAPQRQRAQQARDAWLHFPTRDLPPSIKAPFVLWPLQLVRDNVNQWDLRVKEWTQLLRHFRACLPGQFQLVIKAHPRSAPDDNRSVEALARELPNTVLVPVDTDLKTLLSRCSAVAGANSSVLFEARLMFHKPTYCYAKSWYTNHHDLVVPVHFARGPRALNRLDCVEDNRRLRTERLDDYADWFLCQLLARQVTSSKNGPTGFKEKIDRLSHASFLQHGEDIFEVDATATERAKTNSPTPAAAGARKIILKNFLSPGDTLMLTAAVRDLHQTHPGKFQTDVRTPSPALWEHNPYIASLEEGAEGVESIDCEYPLIHQSNQLPYHFIHAFRLFLQEKLGVEIRPHAFKADLHLSDQEKRWRSQVDEIVGTLGTPFWIIVAGGKKDFTAKWWEPARAQTVVDHFQGLIRWVQCGASGRNHVHPELNGVINLVGKTDLRQMVRLMHHASGVVCPVTMFMHLAAAVETKPERPRNRPCIVVAGGREPSHWEAYPHHTFLHTLGALPCCDNGGCWKSRVAPLGDGDKKDDHLCVFPITTPSGAPLPRCLDMITADDVIRAIERYLSFNTPPPSNAVSPAGTDIAAAATCRPEKRPRSPRRPRPKE